jgi:hypothetical protein
MTDNSTMPKVDLVAIVDTRTSLRADAEALSEAAETAIAAATEASPCDLRVTWLGLEGIWPDTRFSRTLRNYLMGNCGVSDSQLLRLKSPRNTRNDPARGDGAEAIDYLCRYFNWRDRANRAIFYMGDGALGGGDRGGPVDRELCDRAIAAAKSAGVVVHTYFGVTDSLYPEEFQADYARLAEQTGGLSYIAPPDDGGFSAVLAAVIRGSLSTSYSLEMTRPLPCFELITPQSRLGTNRTSTVAIAATNCYTNVTFRDVTVYLSAVTVGDRYAIADRTPVPNLPGEIPAIVWEPNTPIHFGDLPPFDPDASPSPAATTREILVETRGHVTGEFWLNIDYTYAAEFDYEGQVNCPVRTDIDFSPV